MARIVESDASHRIVEEEKCRPSNAMEFSCGASQQDAAGERSEPAASVTRRQLQLLVRWPRADFCRFGATHKKRSDSSPCHHGSVVHDDIVNVETVTAQ
jgi:hypothetical protein